MFVWLCHLGSELGDIKTCRPCLMYTRAGCTNWPLARLECQYLFYLLDTVHVPSAAVHPTSAARDFLLLLGSVLDATLRPRASAKPAAKRRSSDSLLVAHDTGHRDTGHRLVVLLVYSLGWHGRDIRDQGGTPLPSTVLASSALGGPLPWREQRCVVDLGVGVAPR